LSEKDPIYWQPIFSSAHQKVQSATHSNNWIVNRPVVNWSEYTRTTTVRQPNYGIYDIEDNYNAIFEFWGFLGNQDYFKIFDGKVWACEHERSELCASVPPGTLSSNTNGVWRETLTKSSRFDHIERSFIWKRGQLFYPGELSNKTDGVYKCKPWPRSESCGGYEPSLSGAATYIWAITEINPSSTS
jgi:hypothetical protein